MLKVDNIIPLWRFVISKMVLESCLKLSQLSNKEVVSLEEVVKSDSSVEQRVYFVQGLQRKESSLD